MPYEVRKHGSGYEVINKDTGEVHARHTTKAKAEAQVRLLEGVDHSWQPDYSRTMRDGTEVNVKLVGKRKGKKHHG